MAQLEFNISREDYDRLYAIKKEMGYDNLTGNEFAQFLLEVELHRLHPRKVRDGELDE